MCTPGYAVTHGRSHASDICAQPLPLSLTEWEERDPTKFNAEGDHAPHEVAGASRAEMVNGDVQRLSEEAMIWLDATRAL